MEHCTQTIGTVHTGGPDIGLNNFGRLPGTLSQERALLSYASHDIITLPG